MKDYLFTGAVIAALFAVPIATSAFSKARSTATPSPDWFLQGSAPDPGGRAVVAPGGRVVSTGATGGGLTAACSDDIPKYCAGETGVGIRACLAQHSDQLT